ncbi:MAG TPA: prolyl oligopeptidase family serine peptidase [Pyrinomonadaceae bacterium]|nr:prolyl oligopeptidase family serine peptidase [Pyrinomonadaceae bacterium]
MNVNMKTKQLRRTILVICLLSLHVTQLTWAQKPAAPKPAPKFDLSIDSIMRGPRLVGYPPERVYWSQDSQRVYFRWKSPNEPRLKELSLYVVNRDGTGLRRLSDEEAREAPPAGGELSKDKTMTVFTEDGDLFIFDHVKNRRRQVTRTTDAETNPHFTFNQKRLYFTRTNNLYVMSLDDGLLEQLTDIRSGGAGTTTAPPGGGGGRGGGLQGQAGPTRQTGTGDEPQRGTDSQEYLKKEERALLESVRERAEQREEQEKKRKEREKRKPYNLPAGNNVGNLTLSPDGKYVIATLSQPATGAKNIIVPNFVTESGYTEDINLGTKVGDTQTRTRLAIVNVETGEVKNVDHGQREVAPPVRTRTELNSTEQAQRERGDPQARTEQPPQEGGQQGRRGESERSQQPRDREVQMSQLQWSEDGKNAVLMARSADNKDRWVLLLDPATGKTKVLGKVHDDAWVGGPGAFTLGWLPDNERVYFESERDGFAHLYTVSITGGEPAQLTSGQFEVSGVRLSNDKSKFYFTSSEGSFFERHLYSMPLAGGTRTRITSMPGNNQADVSPDDTMLADVRSYSNKPPELYLLANQPAPANAAEAKPVTTSPVPEFSSHNWIDPRIVSIKARDGATVYGRIYIPSNWKGGGPAVLFVHGAGYLQNVHRWWSSYYREYMFHHLLMERGFVVLDIDYRGSAGYGRDWRTGIYRHMGGKDLSDHVDAVDYLAKEHGVDRKRIGMYGGSYGGFITLMGLFTEPDVFAAGAALRPVTDWAHYNNSYTSNILNLPQNDAEAYKRSSPIYFAGGLKGALLICHGMVDTNVNFQDTVRLVERLIELRKENWQVAPYPAEDHGFDREASWADEYKRILKLFTDNLHPENRAPLQKGGSRKAK